MSKHFTYTLIDNKPHIVAENPHRYYNLSSDGWEDGEIDAYENSNDRHERFKKFNPPILWDGPEFEGRKPESEIEFGYQVRGNDWYNTTKDVFDMTDNVYKRQIAKPKEIVTEEAEYKPFKVAFISDIIGQVAKGEISYSRMVEIMNEKIARPKEVEQPVQQSTPIASEGEQRESIVKLKVVWDHMDRVFLMNERGDSYTSKTEELMDFILASESSQEPQATVQKELKELKDISDDDLIEVVSIQWPDQRGRNVDTEWAKRILETLIKGTEVYQYLQSRGYRLPVYYPNPKIKL